MKWPFIQPRIHIQIHWCSSQWHYFIIWSFSCIEIYECLAWYSTIIQLWDGLFSFAVWVLVNLSKIFILMHTNVMMHLYNRFMMEVEKRREEKLRGKKRNGMEWNHHIIHNVNFTQNKITKRKKYLSSWCDGMMMMVKVSLYMQKYFLFKAHAMEVIRSLFPFWASSIRP